MSDITLRLVKGSPLTNQEVDDNFANLNTDKYESGDSASFQDLTLDGMSGPLTWNVDEGTLDVPLNAQVTLQAGQEFVFYAKATEAINNGDVVMFAGAQGGHLLIAKCDMGAVGFDPSHIVGVATQSFAINDFGYVTSSGKVRGIDTSGFTEGTILYVDPTTAGGYTSTKPTPPNHIVQIAAVTRSHATQGTILTRVSHMPDTDEVPEGSTNLYFTDARAVSAIKADGDWNATNWNTAYGWGDHDGLYLPIDAVTLPDQTGHAGQFLTTNGTTADWATVDTSQGDTAFSWGDHALAGYLTSIPTPSTSGWWNGGFVKVGTDGVMEVGKYLDFHTSTSGGDVDYDLRVTASPNVLVVGGQVNATGGNSGQWNIAYGWGDHGAQGYATQSYVNTQVSNLVDSAPSTLDTLNELAAALGDDPNFAATVTNSIGTKWTQDNTKISNWDTAYSWGNHASAGYLTSLPSHNHDGRYVYSDYINSGYDWNTFSYGSNEGVITRVESSAANPPATGVYNWSLYQQGDSVRGSQIAVSAFAGGNRMYLRTSNSGAGWNGWDRMFGDNYHPNADKWTTARSHTVTLTGEVTGTATQSVDGTGNKTWTIGTTLNHDALNDQYVQQLSDTTSPNYTTASSRRVDPNASNPTNEHYAVSTFGNQGNVSGQLATHFVNGQAYTRGHNASWSAWRKQWDSLNDGSGSGLDADLLDGQHGSYYAPASSIGNGTVTITTSGSASGGGTFTLNQSGNTTINISATDTNSTYNFSGSSFVSRDTGNAIAIDSATTNMSGYVNNSSAAGFSDGGAWVAAYSTSWVAQIFQNFRNGEITTRGKNNGTWQSWRKQWDSLNDGSGSGLDADMVDGKHGAAIIDTIRSVYSSDSLGTYIISKDDGGWAGTKPSGSHNGVGVISLHTHSGNYYTQLHLDTSQNQLWIRSANNSTSYGGFAEIWASNNDGSGSGLDADLLDGVHASSFNRKDTNTQYLRPYYAYTNYLTTQNANTLSNEMGGDGGIRVDFINGQSFGTWGHCLTWSGYHAYNMYQLSGYYHVSGQSDLWFRSEKDHTNDEWTAWNKIYHTGNDGSGSGLDADLLDGNQASYFYSPSNVGPSNGVNNTGYGNGNFTYYQTSGAFNVHSGWHGYLISNHGNGSSYYRQVIALPFWGSPTHSRLENGTQRGIFNMWTAENDGSGSGLDADLLDGQHGSYYTGTYTAAHVGLDTSGNTSYPRMFARNNPTSSGDWLRMPSTGGGLLPYSNGNSYLGTSSWRFKYGYINSLNGGTPWTAANDGSGTGLDADLLDGLQASAFINTSSKNASGWHKCATTGVIIQWARIYVTANSTTYWTFPTAFPSACRSISANQESNNAGIGDNSQFYGITRTGATLRNGWNSLATYFNVFAIGY